MQKLEIYQSFWGMEMGSPPVPERTNRETFRMVAEAGFDGMCLDPYEEEASDFLRFADLYEEFDLGCMVNAFPQKPDGLQPFLRLATELNACCVNVIGGVMPIRPADGVAIVQQWMAEADRVDMQLLFETHRDGLLNDLYFTLQMLELVPEMRLCADLSHFVVDREFRSPIPERDQRYMENVLNRSDSFQGRVSNGEQVQIQVGFPQHQDWVATFKGWWKYGMREWRKRNADDARLVFLCELGPPPYAMTDRDQRELSDRWEEALQLRRWAQEIWAELEDEGVNG
jgi:hypothetical protein